MAERYGILGVIWGMRCGISNISHILEDILHVLEKHFSLVPHPSYKIIVSNTMNILILSLNEPQREKTYLLSCAPNEDTNQVAHPHRRVRVFVVRMT